MKSLNGFWLLILSETVLPFLGSRTKLKSTKRLMVGASHVLFSPKRNPSRFLKRKNMNTIKIGKRLLSTSLLGVFLCLSTQAQAQEAPTDFQVVCFDYGTAFLQFGDAASEGKSVFDARDAGSQGCVVSGDREGAVFECACDGGTTKAQGKVDDSIFGESSDPGWAASPGAKVDSICTRVFHQECGPFPEPVLHTCVSSAGSCDIEAEGDQRDAGVNQLSRTCECSNGAAWVEESRRRDGVALSGAQAEELCLQELAYCEAEHEPGPGPSPLVPDAQVESQLLGCAQTVNDGLDARTCEVGFEDDEVSIECECGEFGFEKELELKVHPGYGELRRICKEELARCLSPVPEEPAEPEEEPVPEIPDVEDCWDLLGCSLAQNSRGNQSLWLSLLVLFGLGAGRRKK